MNAVCGVKDCGQPVPDGLLQCPDCRAGRYPETRNKNGDKTGIKSPKKSAVVDPRSEAEIRRELVDWCYLKGALKVIDTEQGYRPDKCKHCGGELGRGNASTRIVRGFPDLIVFWPAPRRTWWIEVKSAKGKQTEHQVTMQKWLLAAGEIYAIARSVQDLEQLELAEAARAARDMINSQPVPHDLGVHFGEP